MVECANYASGIFNIEIERIECIRTFEGTSTFLVALDNAVILGPEIAEENF